MDWAPLALAMAAGSVMLSHVNDSDYWPVGRFFGMDVRATPKKWAVMQTLVGPAGLALSWLVWLS